MGFADEACLDTAQQHQAKLQRKLTPSINTALFSMSRSWFCALLFVLIKGPVRNAVVRILELRVLPATVRPPPLPDCRLIPPSGEDELFALLLPNYRRFYFLGIVQLVYR